MNDHDQCRYGKAAPMHTRTLDALDPGIAQAVLYLHEHGIETYESCEGGDGHAFLEPTVRFHGGPGEGFRAYSIAVMYALPVRELRRVWSTDHGELNGPTWEITFAAVGVVVPSDTKEENE